MTPSTFPSSETLKIRPGKVSFPMKSTWLGPGVMQIELGAPITAARRSPIGAIADVEVVVAVRHNSMREAELSRRSSLFAPGLHPIAILVEFRDARIDISVRNVDVAFGVPSHIGRLAKHS